MEPSLSSTRLRGWIGRLLIYLVGIPLAVFAFAPVAVTHILSAPSDSLRWPSREIPRDIERDEPGQASERAGHDDARPIAIKLSGSAPVVQSTVERSRPAVGAAIPAVAGSAAEPTSEPDPLRRVYERLRDLQPVECDGGRPSLPAGFDATIICSNAGDLLTGVSPMWVYAGSITMYTNTRALLFAAADGDPNAANVRFTSAVAETLDALAVRALLDAGTPSGHELPPEVLAMIGPEPRRVRMQSDDGRWQSILLLAEPEREKQKPGLLLLCTPNCALDQLVLLIPQP